MRIKIAKNGYTLIEVLVSIGIIAIFFVLFQAASSTAILNRAVKHRDLALRIAESEISNLRLAGYAALPAGGGLNDPQLSSLPGGSGTVQITDYNEKIKEVTVTVYWSEPGAATENVSAVTLIGKGGI